MMKFIPDVNVGDKFGRLIFVSLAHRSDKGRQWYWNCKCDCGKEVVVMGCSLRSGATKSCGCLQKETAGNANRTHGKSRTKIHGIWKNIRQRCCNSNNPRFSDYGGRGIVMCERWKESFENFYQDVGDPPPDKSLDRIDNNGPYSKENARWSSDTQQIRNRRISVSVLVGDANLSLKELCDTYQMDYYRAYHMIVRRKFSLADTISVLRDSMKPQPA